MRWTDGEDEDGGRRMRMRWADEGGREAEEDEGDEEDEEEEEKIG